MSKSPNRWAGQLGGDRPNIQEMELAMVNDQDRAMPDNAPSRTSTMLSNGARPLAVQLLENAGESTVRSTMDNDPLSDEPQRQPPSPLLDTPTSILDEGLARPSLAAMSPPSEGAGPSTRPKITRSKT